VKRSDLDTVASYTRGLMHVLSEAVDPRYRLRLTIRHDRSRDADNRKSPRAMACASFKKGSPIVGVCENIIAVPAPFLVGIMLHELTHLAFNLMGDAGCEVDVDETIMRTAADFGYRYANARYTDVKTGKARVANNLECVDEMFAEQCGGWLSERGEPVTVAYDR
jgi:hypothetical protein